MRRRLWRRELWLEPVERGVRVCSHVESDVPVELAARSELCSAWETGTAAQVATAMFTFRDKHVNHFREQAKASPANALECRRWLADVVWALTIMVGERH